MSFNPDTLKKIADLSQIAIEADQLDKLADDLANIINMVEKMNSIDTDQVTPLSHPLDATQPLRLDKVTETNQRERFQSIAPQTQAGLYIVPKVIETE